jgi:hypothetical protein
MRIIAKPKLCILYFDFQIGDSVFDVEVRQNIGHETNIEVKVLDSSGNPVSDERLINVITDYSIQKYSISYEEENESNLNNYQSEAVRDVRPDPPI